MLEENATKKKRDNSLKNQSLVCPNPMCGKTFTKPLKVENLSSGTTKVYEACPYCLTEITVEEAVSSVEQRLTTVEEKKAVKLELKETIVQQPSAEAPKCQHHFGYLSERTSRDKLPEECMLCPKIVQCMLKGVTG